MGPMQPACQKWTSDLVVVSCYDLPHLVSNSPADTSALDCDCDLARSELLAALNLLERRLGLGDPEIMCRVGVNTNV
jgi:hypothetical protein